MLKNQGASMTAIRQLTGTNGLLYPARPPSYHAQLVLSRMQLTPHATRRTPHGGFLALGTRHARQVGENPTWSVPQCRDARVIGVKTTATREMSTSPTPRPTPQIPVHAMPARLVKTRRGPSHSVGMRGSQWY